MMDPYVLKVAQLKALRKNDLSTTGRNTELVLRMQAKDPTGA